MKFQPREEILTFEEIERFVRVAVTLGVRKLRITVWKLWLRKGLAQLIGRLGKIDGIQDMALTTNGVLLGGSGAGTLRCWAAAVEHTFGYARPGALSADHAARRFWAGDGRN